ncbi:MAG TPA: hypothetical protein VMV03_08160 [Spirochaetia bacterium]|nr:hypothetical protein [Spirochaetia bacterium]
MYFTPISIRVGAEQKGFESGAARPVIAMRLTSGGETELLLATDDGGLSWVDRDFVTVVSAGAQHPAALGAESKAVEPEGPRAQPAPRKRARGRNSR